MKGKKICNFANCVERLRLFQMSSFVYRGLPISFSISENITELPAN